MENYWEYKILGSIKQVRMKENCVPSKFDCPPENGRKAWIARKRYCSTLDWRKEELIRQAQEKAKEKQLTISAGMYRNLAGRQVRRAWLAQRWRSVRGLWPIVGPYKFQEPIITSSNHDLPSPN